MDFGAGADSTAFWGNPETPKTAKTAATATASKNVRELIVDDDDAASCIVEILYSWSVRQVFLYYSVVDPRWCIFAHIGVITSLFTKRKNILAVAVEVEMVDNKTAFESSSRHISSMCGDDDTITSARSTEFLTGDWWRSITVPRRMPLEIIIKHHLWLPNGHVNARKNDLHHLLVGSFTIW